MGKIHAAKVKKSGRLRRVLAYLRGRGAAGATGYEITRACDLNGTEAFRELRAKANGYDIRCKRERTTTNGRQVHRYTLVEAAERALLVVLLVPWALLAQL